jgi:hypothetical protein
MSYAPLTSGKAKEDAVIAWVMALEREQGRVPRHTRYKERHYFEVLHVPDFGPYMGRKSGT